MDPTIKKIPPTHLAFSAQHIQPTSPFKIPTNLTNPFLSKPDPAKSLNTHTATLISRKSPYNIRPQKKLALNLKDDSYPPETSPPSSSST